LLFIFSPLSKFESQSEASKSEFLFQTEKDFSVFFRCFEVQQVLFSRN
jgi:hypothetical protein